MNDYNGMSKAVREELASMTDKDKLEKEQEKPDKHDNFWRKLRENILIFLNKAPK